MKYGLLILFLLHSFMKAYPDSVPKPVLNATRLLDRPILHFKDNPLLEGNVNGPSLMKVPDWVPNPLGKYYLYFGHHHGDRIRLAFADDLLGPWTLHTPGVIPLETATVFHGHLASPDIHVDHHNQEFLMFLHGPVEDGEFAQMTALARSKDGLTWTVEDQQLGQSYFRAFRYDGYWYAISNVGFFYRAKDPSQPWEKREQKLIDPVSVHDSFGRRENVRVRHSAVLVEGDSLFVFYTRKQDAPERILCVRVPLANDWNDWTPSAPVEVLRPERPWEGSDFPVKPSELRVATGVHQLRDPCIYREGDAIYLLYSVAGEEGIGIARLLVEGVNDGN